MGYVLYVPAGYARVMAKVNISFNANNYQPKDKERIHQSMKKLKCCRVEIDETMMIAQSGRRSK